MLIKCHQVIIIISSLAHTSLPVLTLPLEILVPHVGSYSKTSVRKDFISLNYLWQCDLTISLQSHTLIMRYFKAENFSKFLAVL